MEILEGSFSAMPIFANKYSFSSSFQDFTRFPFQIQTQDLQNSDPAKNWQNFAKDFFLFLKDARPARWGPPDGWEPPGARSRKGKEKNGFCRKLAKNSARDVEGVRAHAEVERFLARHADHALVRRDARSLEGLTGHLVAALELRGLKAFPRRGEAK